MSFDLLRFEPRMTAAELERRHNTRIALAIEATRRGFDLGEFMDKASKALSYRRLATEVYAGYGPRGIDGGIGANKSQTAFGDIMISEYLFTDTSATMTIGTPLYVDVTDAAEWNAYWPTTAVTGGVRTGGSVVLGTNAKAVNLICVGVFYPEASLGELAAAPGVVKCIWLGRTPVLAAAITAGTAVLVGDYLVASSTQAAALSGHNTPVLAKTIATALATGAATASGNSIIAVPGSGTTSQAVNGFVKLQ